MNSLGRHIIVEYFNCNPDILNDVILIETSMVGAAKEAEATVINSTFHHFSPFGVSGVVVIQESHLAIHTWPEFGYAAVDVFTCGEVVDPWISYKFLEKAFEASHGSAMEMARGMKGLLRRADFEMPDTRDENAALPTLKVTRDIWMTERDEQIALSLKHKGERIFNGQSDYQKVEIYDTHAYGKLLTLDGMIMTSEKDEYVYHEMITHIPLQTLPNAKRVLIIGGGDGGAARECLRYEGIEEVVMVEIDGMVIDACKKHFPKIASEFDNPRLTLHVADGIDYVRNTADGSFDLVIVDSTDPVGPAEGLFTEKFYRDVYRILKPDGLMLTQSESPRFNTKVFQEIYQVYRGIYGQNNVHCYLAYIPTYPTGMWSFSYSSKNGQNPLTSFDAVKAESFAQKHGLKYYNAVIHQAAFALPGFVKELIS